jgi:signal transduction histidine kinase
VFSAAHNLHPFPVGAERGGVVGVARAARGRLAAEVDDARASRQRERLARDLHDSVGSSLSLTALYADLLAQAGGDARGRLATALTDAAAQSVSDLRETLEGLAGATEADVAAMIERRARRLASTSGVEIAFRASGSTAMSSAARLAVLRIAEEAIANALRHAHAARVEIELECDAREARLSVSDDGRGLGAAPRGGRGLPNMRARVEELGGAITIESTDRGTRIQARIPCGG